MVDVEIWKCVPCLNLYFFTNLIAKLVTVDTEMSEGYSAWLSHHSLVKMANMCFPQRTFLIPFSRYLDQQTTGHGQIKCVQGPWPAMPCARRLRFLPAGSKPLADQCRIPCLSRRHVAEGASQPSFSSRETSAAGLL